MWLSGCWVVLKGLAEGLDLVISLKPRPGRRKSRKEAFPASDAPPTLPSPNVGVSASSGSSGSVRNVATTERNDVMASKIDANSSSSDSVWEGDGQKGCPHKGSCPWQPSMVEQYGGKEAVSLGVHGGVEMADLTCSWMRVGTWQDQENKPRDHPLVDPASF